MALDFDADATAFAAQPFWLAWSDADRPRSHAPGFVARTRHSVGVVVDCRSANRVRSRYAAAFAATERAYTKVGWEYRLVTGYDLVWPANLRCLAGYRHRLSPIESRVTAVARSSGPTRSTSARAGPVRGARGRRARAHSRVWAGGCAALPACW